MPEYFGRIPEGLFYDKEVSAGAKVIYAYIAMRAGARESWYISQTEIAERLSVSRSHVIRSLAVLEARGWIELDRTPGRVITYRPTGNIKSETLTVTRETPLLISARQVPRNRNTTAHL